MSAQQSPSLPNLLIRNSNFVMLWAAYGVAAIGDHLSEMALLRERDALNRPDGTRVQALISFGFFLPFVLLAPVAGWLSDRISRRSIMIAADLLRAAIVINLAWLVSTLQAYLEPRNLGDYSIVIPLAIVGALASFFSPARQALLPTLVRDDQLVRANAMISALGTIGTIISAVVGGYLVTHAGPNWNYRINAITFVLSAAFVSMIAMSRSRATPLPPLDGVWKPVADGFRYVFSHRRVFQLILLGTLFWAAAGVVISVVPAIVRRLAHSADYSAAGLYRGVLGIGLATGAAVMTILGPTLPTQLAVLAALSSAALWIALLDFSYVMQLGMIPAGICLFFIGGAGAALLVTIMASIQLIVPDSRRGRVFGVSDMATMGAMVAASGALGLPHVPNLDDYIPYLLAGCVIAFCVAVWLAWRVFTRAVGMRPVTWFWFQAARFVARFWWRVECVGHCTVPTSGPILIASNHASGIDPLVIQATAPRVISFLVERAYYDVPVATWFMRLVRCVPVDRQRPSRAALRESITMLREGGCLGIFPSGGIDGDGAPKPGIGMISLHSGARVIPCRISGATPKLSPFGSLFARHHARIRYGPPVDLSDFAGRARERGVAQQVADRIQQHIDRLAIAGDERSATRSLSI
ncbi:MAG: MFS transporter [Phycisphaerales bacterium]|nr:MFS transporter [Phycisphaerales bacterium]